jgi:hypothetical protein
MRNILLILLMTACTGSADSVPAFVDSQVVDAPRGLTATPVSCVKYSRTVTFTGGTKLVSDQYYALISGIAPTDEYFVESSLVVFPDPCPMEATCNDTGMPPPKGGSYWVHRSGTFTSYGKLLLSCGTRYQNFNAAGMLVSDADYRTTATLYR